MTIDLHGYRISVYSWIARLTLHEKGVVYRWREVDPFAAETPAGYLDLHPFKRVPVLVHDGFALYETVAIARYVDEAFPGPRLQADDPKARARGAQIVSIVDSYGYWPLVRQVFAHDFLRARDGRGRDAAEVAAGLQAAPRTLAALERLAGDDVWLTGPAVTLADLHLAPMLAYFAMAPSGAAQLADFPRLSRWFARVSERPAFVETRPPLPED